MNYAQENKEQTKIIIDELFHVVVKNLNFKNDVSSELQTNF